MANNDNIQITISPGTIFINTTLGQFSYAKLTVTISNATNAAINISDIAIALPATLAPVNTLDSIEPGMDPATAALWNFGRSQLTTNEFDASAQTGTVVSLNAGKGFAFTLDMITLPNSVLASAAQVNATVTFADSTTFTQPLTVNMAAAVASITFFNAQISTINPGESAKLQWQCTGIDYCILDPVDTIHRKPAGQADVNPTASIAYTLYAYAAGTILAAQWEITVGNPAIITFGGIKDQSTAQLGSGITLVWICNQFVKKIKLANDSEVAVPADLLTDGNTTQKGKIEVSPLIQPTNFTFTAKNADGSVYDARTVTIGIGNVNIEASASPNNVWQRDRVTLDWWVGSASEITITPALPGGPSLTTPYGRMEIQCESNYIINAKGFINNKPATISQSLQINVTPVLINKFALSPDVLKLPDAQGSQCTLEWDTQAELVALYSSDNGISNLGSTPPGSGSRVLTGLADGTTFTITAGTYQNPLMLTQTIVFTNAHGPFTFTGPIKQEGTDTFFNIQNPRATFLADYGDALILTQFTGVGITYGGVSVPDVTARVFFIDATTLMVPYTTFAYTNPDVQSGTVTLIGLC